MPSFSYKLIEKIVKTAGIKKYYQMDREGILKLYEKKLKKLKSTPPKALKKNYHVNEITVAQHCCYKVSSKEQNKKAVLFLHGGGYITEISNLHWSAIQKMVEQKKTNVYVPIYPLAPRNDWKNTFSMLNELYQLMLKNYKPNEITFVGDSAGAQIALSFGQQCLQTGLPQPNKMILLSPPVNFAPNERTMKRYQELDAVDPMISTGILSFVKEFWANGTDPGDYHISPINGIFKGLAPMEVFCGTKEIMYATINDLKEKVLESNGNINLHIGQDMIHVWPYFLWSKESKTSFSEIIHLI